MIRKKKGVWALIVCGLMVTGFFLPQQVSAETVLQVSAAPGVSIWLNRDLQGKTTKEQNGLVITGLAPGEYFLKASMPGYDAVDTQFTIEADQTVEWRIKLVGSALKVEDSVKRIESDMVKSELTGTVVAQSIPLNAEIFFNGKSVGAAGKKLSYVPAAKHTVKFVYQGQELAKEITLQPDESMVLMADFIKKEVISESALVETMRGPAVILMQTARKRKPALFPHRKHQGMFECANCHHGMDSDGKQLPYTEGMEIQHCVTCHNPSMDNPQLNSLMLAAHTRCKGCHRKIVAESGTAGPIDKCIGCHNIPDEK